MVHLEFEWTKVLFLESQVCYALWMDFILGVAKLRVHIVTGKQGKAKDSVVLIVFVPVDVLVCHLCFVQAVHATVRVFLDILHLVFHASRWCGKFIPVLLSALVQAQDILSFDSIFVVVSESHQFHILGVILDLLLSVALNAESHFKVDVVQVDSRRVVIPIVFPKFGDTGAFGLDQMRQLQ